MTSSIQASASVAIGAVESGRVACAEIVVANVGGSAFVLERIESSCECLTVDPASLRLGAGESSVLRVVFDTSREADFRGELGVEVIGRASVGAVASTTNSRGPS